MKTKDIILFNDGIKIKIKLHCKEEYSIDLIRKV